jgi:tubulin-like protein
MANQPRILVLGLGGTGLEALLQVKTLFNECPGKVPAYVGLLYLDTVAPKSRADVSLLDVESLRLVLRDAPGLLRNPDAGYVLDWFPSDINVQTVVHGAAQIRPLGRLALHAQPDRVLRQLRTCLATLTDRERLREIEEGESIDEHGSIEVYILASLCGGSGSSIIIDVAQLIREELRDAPTVRLVGVFLLPGPFRHLAGTSLVTANAYAALKELDYLADPRTGIDISFGPAKHVTLDRSPFDLVYLVDSVGERFDTTTSVPQLARQMAYLPYLMSTPSVGPHVREILHNLVPQLETKELVQGKRATYASFGVATLEVPPSSVEKARVEFECELLNGLLADTENVEHLGDLGVQNALDKYRSEQFPEALEMLLLEFDFRNPSELIDKLEEIYATAVGLVEEYARKLLEPHLRALREFGERAIQSLILDASMHPGRILSALRECSRLQAHLKNVKESLRTQNKSAEHAEKERHRAWELCQQAFKSRRRRRREAAAVDWKGTVNSLVLPSRLGRIISDLSVDAVSYLIDRVLEAEELCSTARRNLQETLRRLSEKETTIEKPPGPFTRYCDAATIRPRADAGKFLAGLTNPQSWLGLGEAEVRSAVTAFSEQEFVPAFARGGPSSATRLVLANLHESIAELRRFSDPLWSYSPSKIPPGHQRGIHHIEVLGVDAVSGEVQPVYGHYPGLGIVETGWWDRAVHLQIRAGIPLFALTCMDELWRDYARLSNGLREKCHIDRRWAGWPELLPHAFNRAVIEVFAQGLASHQIDRSGSGIMEYRSNSAHNQVLGKNFCRTYQALTGDSQLFSTLSDSVQMWNSKNTGAEIRMKAEELWELLAQNSVSVEDRPLVEALIYCLEHTVIHLPLTDAASI